ncbi:MAG: bifunctional serine/threonine-protein kinase/formylglycine-generating enzyme family protein [Chloroflexota bacterium]
MSNFIGQSLGRYHILEQLGEGGMATVYRARDMRVERDVAVKVIRTEMLSSHALERVLRRFKREARALGKLSHPNIVGVIDYGEHEGMPYLVMEYLPGGTLKQKLAGKPILWQEAARLLAPIAKALQYAHEQGIVHRDIKPSNILLTQSGEPMLADFGIASILESEATTVDLTATGGVVGTPEYMAPEQGLKHASDARVDIYALGVILYEMITGRPPYRADTPLAVLLKKSTEPLPRPSRIVPNLPRNVEYALIKALQRDPKNRYQTASAFGLVLENLAVGKPVAEDRAGVPWINLKRLALPLAGIFAICLVGILGVIALVNVQKEFPAVPISPSAQTESVPVATSRASATISTVGFSSPPPSTEVDQGPSSGMTMILIPAGEFAMGGGNADSQAKPDEFPQHDVFLNQYWIDSTEVTAKMYMACVNAGVCNLDAFNERTTVDMLEFSDYYTNPEYENYPAVEVTWENAARYCEWAGKRLPTEAEWEKAAHGVESRLYPWGNQWLENALNFCDLNCLLEWHDGSANDKYKYRAPVGSFPSGASFYGLYDMAGNVWEWVADWYSESYYARSPSENPTGPLSGSDRVIRGGGWDSPAPSTRASKRFHKPPVFYSGSLGFRCASSIAP